MDMDRLQEHISLHTVTFYGHHFDLLLAACSLWTTMTSPEAGSRSSWTILALNCNRVE